MDAQRLAQLLDASAVLGPCRDLPTLGPALFRVLQTALPLDRLDYEIRLWLGNQRKR